MYICFSISVGWIYVSSIFVGGIDLFEASRALFEAAFVIFSTFFFPNQIAICFCSLLDDHF